MFPKELSTDRCKVGSILNKLHVELKFRVVFLPASPTCPTYNKICNCMELSGGKCYGMHFRALWHDCEMETVLSLYNTCVAIPSIQFK
jgi:hypothetical protein